jgi:hypothetical protein
MGRRLFVKHGILEDLQAFLNMVRLLVKLEVLLRLLVVPLNHGLQDLSHQGTHARLKHEPVKLGA